MGLIHDDVEACDSLLILILVFEIGYLRSVVLRALSKHLSPTLATPELTQCEVGAPHMRMLGYSHLRGKVP